ncbi:MAG: 23S rRNA (uracil(1939)-C(5))-methyltransferase RlmD [Defluviitaleaceae bacterium]|nr:23S rRNA (uracil(1939)-C(5))-methyltransferase RlmD [Defluviitaleaceae bacterium]
MIKKNANLTIEVENVTAKGFGIAKVNDFVLLTEGGLPGDKLSVKVIKVKKTYGYAKIIHILTPSPHRIQSPCPVSDKCGGCQWQHCDYQAQLGFKKQIVTDALTRIGGCTNPPVSDVIGMEAPQPYRNKAVFPVVPSSGDFAIGMYAPRSHRIIPIEECAIQHPVHVPVIKIVGDFMRRHKVSAYDEITHTGIMRHIIIRTSQASGEVMVVLVVNADNLPKENKLATALIGIGATTVLVNHNKAKGNVIMSNDFRCIAGEGYIREKIGDVWYQLSAPSFFQINPVQTAVLYGIAVDMAGLTGNDIVMDAHVGVGGVALAAAGQARQVIGIDIVQEAITDAEKNAAINGITNAKFICSAAEEVIPKMLQSGEPPPDVIFLDPPRKGCEVTLLDALVAACVKTIVYISCDPATLARDIKILAQGGYELVAVRPVDMFPMTGKVESVALLRRTDM